MSATGHPVSRLSPGDLLLGDFIGYTSDGAPRVVEAAIQTSGLRVAVKQLALEALFDAQDKFERTQRTLQLETQLFHPLLLTHLAAFTVPAPSPSLWVVYPLMLHGSVAEILLSVTTRGLEEIVVAHLMREAVKAVEYLHSVGIIMRVVCAQSIFIAGDCTVKLGAFEHALSLPHRAPVHAVLAAPDHIPWIAPEILRQSLRGYTQAADVYSLAACAFEIACGTKPFDDLEVPRVLLMKLQDQFPSPPRGHQLSSCFLDFLRVCVAAPHLRPSATRLLAHPFLSQVKRTPPALYDLCTKLPPLHERAARIAALRRQQPQNYNPMFLQPHLSRKAFAGLSVGGLMYASSHASAPASESQTLAHAAIGASLPRLSECDEPAASTSAAAHVVDDGTWDFGPSITMETDTPASQEPARQADQLSLDVDDLLATRVGGLVVSLGAVDAGSTTSL